MARACSGAVTRAPACQKPTLAEPRGQRRRRGDVVAIEVRDLRVDEVLDEVQGCRSAGATSRLKRRLGLHRPILVLYL